MPYLLRKFGLLLLTLWVAVTLNFVLPRLIPGDPFSAMIAKARGQINPEAAEALRAYYGLDNQGSVFHQYFTYLGHLLSGDFQRSFSQGAPVSEIVGMYAPWTIGLVGVTTILSFLIGSGLGLYSAWRRGRGVADALPPVGLFLNAMPYFWFGLIMLYIFAFQLSWFPLSGSQDNFPGPAFTPKWWSGLLTHAVLPGLTILITAAGGWLVTMRNNVMGVMGEDYVAFARAKGLSDGRILNRYVLRNALLPSFTAFGLALGFVVGGAILTEIVFGYSGLGLQLNNAVFNLDYPLMQAIFLFIALGVLIANFIVDALYVFLDPRVRDTRTA